MSVVSMAVGAPAADGATFAAKVDGGGPVRVAVADNAGMADPVFTGSQAVDADGVAKVAVTGLDPASQWWWQVEDNGALDTSTTGRFRTHPTVGLPASFALAIGNCAGATPAFPGQGSVLASDRLSNHPVFDTIRSAVLSGQYLMFVHGGDLHYYDLDSGQHGIVGGSSLANYRRGYDDVLLQPRQHQLYREVATAYTWDNHDFSQGITDGTAAGRDNACNVYRERWPHFTLPAGAGANPIYQSWQIGRVQFVMTDSYADRNIAGGTLLGSAQKTWLDGVLAASDAEFLVWLQSAQWMRATSQTTWGEYPAERDEIVELFGDRGWLGRMCTVYGDRHGLGIDSGGRNLWGGFPVMCTGSMDSGFGANLDLYDVLNDTQGRDQWGTLEVQDLGSVISVRLSAMRGTTLMGSHQFAVAVESPAPVASGALLRTLAGSFTPVLEARVVTGHPTGDDPDGTDIDVVGGDVTFDGTAEIRGTMQLDTLGISDATGRSTFPRLVSDLLAPYGAEVFLRYGLDLGGGGILWTPLGYYRIEEPDQGQAPYGVISLDGADRMAGIVEADLLSPRSYSASTTLGTVVQDLVEDIYPAAVIVWDDSSDGTPLGRVLVVEESRYEAIKDIADSQGKIVYWDGEGILRIESAPDESDPVWEVKSGRGGVMIAPSRRISRRGIANAVILIGQAADDLPPIRTVAIDNNPQSPTYFFGDFGQVPRKVESTLVNNIDQANTAAQAILRRSLGAPYQVEFTSVVNPTLRPHQPVRVTTADGNRDLMVMQRVVIPLTASRPMTGTTRTRILAAIGSLA